MSHIRLQCPECAAQFAPDMSRLRCAECASPLDVAYIDAAYIEGGRADAARAAPTDDATADAAPPPAMPSPLHSPADAVALGEGDTPSVRLRALGDMLGLEALYAKLEFMNPTGSFKDRGTAVMVSAAKELGAREVVEDSSGNAGASVAAYAARAGVKAHIFAPANAPAAKLSQIKVYGATAHLIEGSRQAATDAATDFAAAGGLVYASHNLSPFFLEGTKTFAYEIARQFGGRLPKHIVMPVGNGSLLIGAHKGFDELRRNGLIEAMPRLHAVQARAVMPLAAAFGEGSAPPIGDGNATTIAGGISVANPPRLKQSIEALRNTGGSAVAVSDADIARWHALLARSEGIFAEPTAAAAFAGLELLVKRGAIRQSEPTLLPITGFGLKDAIP